MFVEQASGPGFRKPRERVLLWVSENSGGCLSPALFSVVGLAVWACFGLRVRVSGLRDTSALDPDLFGEMLQSTGPGLELEDGWVLGGSGGNGSWMGVFRAEEGLKGCLLAQDASGMCGFRIVEVLHRVVR